jgi:hypothetical protein
MTHPRRLIRNALVARLSENLTPPPEELAEGQQPPAPTYPTMAGPRIFAGRPAPLEEGQLPAIVIHTREPENVESYPASGWSGFTRRQTIAMVECYLQSFDDVDDELDDFADQIEAMFESWDLPGFESGEIRLADTSSEVEWDGSLSTGCVKLRFEVTYRRPYRSCSNPYVDPSQESIYRSGAYPGGQVTPGCPADNSGEACPIGSAELFSQEEPIN